MKRRDFLRSAGAAATIPVLPLPAAAVPAAPAPVHAAKVGWAALYARTHAKASPAMIQKWLGVGPEQAHALMSELVAKNILRAPVGGAAMAVDPIYKNYSIPGARPVAARAAEAAKKVMRDAARDLLDPNQIEQTKLEETADETS